MAKEARDSEGRNGGKRAHRRRPATSEADPLIASARMPAGDEPLTAAALSNRETVAVVIVSYDDPQATAQAVASVHAQSVAPAEILVVDNHPDHPAAALAAIHDHARVLTPSENLGFAGGAALGARSTTSAWILFLNPDATAAPDCLAQLLAAGDADTGLIGAQILLPDGRINAGDNPVHVTGIAWAGGYLAPREQGPPRSVASVSGAGMLVRRTALDAVGGISERYFLYHEDVDLALRLRLGGWDVRFQPAAIVTHDYSFAKGTRKWFYLERNRAWTVLTCYATRTLVLLAPLLLATEVSVAVKARREGWWPEKREAWHAVWSSRRETRTHRREVQALRQVGDHALIVLMRATIETDLIDDQHSAVISRALRTYRRMLLALIR